MNLPVGIKVVMSEYGKRKWKNSKTNPHNTYGILEEADSEELDFGKRLYEDGIANQDDYFGYHVAWSNGARNSYRYGDLSPAISLEEKRLEDYL